MDLLSEFLEGLTGLQAQIVMTIGVGIIFFLIWLGFDFIRSILTQFNGLKGNKE